MWRAPTLLALGALSTACAPQTDAELETDGFATLVVALRAADSFEPQVIDLREPLPQLTYGWTPGRETYFAFWPQTIEALRLIDPGKAATDTTCSANRLAFTTAAQILCHDAAGTLGPCQTKVPEEFALETVAWAPGVHHPCNESDPFQELARIDFDVQTTTTSRVMDPIAAGGAMIAISMGDGRMVLGQHSGGVVGTFELNTELAVADARTIAADFRPELRVRSTTAWSAGTVRDAGSVWIAGPNGKLAVFDVSTGAITVAVAATSSTAFGLAADLVSDPIDRERVYLTTDICGVYVRDPGARVWTEILPALIDIPLLAPGLREGACAGRIAVSERGEALVVGVAAETVDRPNLTNYQDDRDLLLRIRGGRLTIDDPWPAIYAGDARWQRRLMAVTTYVDAAGEEVQVLLGAHFTERPDLKTPPYPAGAGTNVMFTRRGDDPWRFDLARPASDLDTNPLEPVIFSDAWGVHEAPLSWKYYSGFLVGARLLVFGADELRARQGARMPLIPVRSPGAPAVSFSNSIGDFPLVGRIRSDGLGGFLVATGETNDARTAFARRFHWWRPRR